MQQTCVFNCFMFCFLLLIYMADSSPASISGSNEGNMVDDRADDGKSNDDVAIDDENSDEAVADETMNADENDPVQDDNQDKNEPIDDGNEKSLQGDVQDEQLEGVDAQDDVTDANEPIVEEEKANEEQDDAPVQDDAESNNRGQDDTVKLEEEADDKTNEDQNKFNGPDKNQKVISTLEQKAFNLSPAEIEKFKLWPNATVSYFIDEFSYDKFLRDKIRSYLDNAELNTMVHFHELPEPPTDEAERWVLFVNRRGLLDCKDYSTNSFTNKGVQKVTVGYNCLKHGGPMAGIVLALLGVPPQHNSPDRDKFITVATEHILPEKAGLFNVLRDDEWLFHDLEYDYSSAGHYPPHKYTADGSSTISAKPGNLRSGKLHEDFENILKTEEVKDYSHGDLIKTYLLYGNILRKKQLKGMKLTDCKALFRPGPGFGNTRLTAPKELPVMPKPKQYVAAVKKLYGQDYAMLGETLSSLES